MPLLKIKSKFQITLPVRIRTKLGWNIEDILSAHFTQNRIIIKKITDNTDKDNFQISIRQRFQFTLPIVICKEFSLIENGLLEAHVENDSLVLIPQVLLSDYRKPLQKKQIQQPKTTNEFRSDGLSNLIKNK